MSNKFTFKTEKPTGKWKSFQKASHSIKLNKCWVGSIEPEYPFYIRLMVIKKDIMEDKNPNCEWMWKTLAHKSQSLDEAKQFCNDNIDLILNKFNLKKQQSC